MLKNLLQQLIGKEMDYWMVAQHQPQHFCKDGEFYQQVMRQYGDRLQHNAHIQFQELPGKTFAYNAEKECLELCLGKVWSAGRVWSVGKVWTLGKV